MQLKKGEKTIDIEIWKYLQTESLHESECHRH